MSKLLLTIFLFGGLLSMVACNTSSPTSFTTTQTAGPQVIATFWTAQLIGELAQVGDCLRVNDRDSDTSYLLVWPPDLAVTIEGNTVRVVSGIVTQNRKEVVLHMGTLVYLGGGETTHLDEQLQQTIPANCQGPYWVVGNEVSPFEPK